MSTKPPPILSKILSACLWSMRYPIRKSKLGEESFDHTADLLGFLLAHHVDRAVRQGLYRSYQPVEDMILGLRGTLDPWQTTSRLGQLSGKTVCRWDELDTDHPIHRGIAYHADLLLGTNHLEPHTRMKLEEGVEALKCRGTRDGELLFRQPLPSSSRYQHRRSADPAIEHPQQETGEWKSLTCTENGCTSFSRAFYKWFKLL